MARDITVSVSFPILLFLMFPVSHAQTANPYIGQFPTIERVRTAIKGSDTTDTTARHVGAFWQLRQIVEQMAGFRRYRNQMTQEEGRLIGQYNLGYQQSEAAIPAGLDKIAWNRTYNKYLYDDGLREEIFEKLLNPQIRAQWAQTTGNVDRQVKVNQQARDRAAEQEGFYKRAPSGTATAATEAVGSVDPSIAKAAAAKVDTKVVGLQLGDPLNLPECNILGFDSVITAGSNQTSAQRTCVAPDLNVLEGLGVGLLGIKVDSSEIANIKTVRLTKDYCPGWVDGCAAYVSVHNGRVSGVALFTKGRGFEKTVTADLRAKYGPQTYTESSTITTENGVELKVNNPEWTRPGL